VARANALVFRREAFGPKPTLSVGVFGIRNLNFLKASCALNIVTVCLLALASGCAQEIQTISAGGGITASGSKPSFTTSFGTLNGLGVGTPPTGTTLYSSGVIGGVLYTSPLSVQIAGAGGVNPAVVKAYMSSNFTHSSVLSAEVCYPTCTSASNYSAISLSSGSPTTVIGQPGVQNNFYTVYFGVFVSNGNGANYSSGTDSAVIILNVYNGSNNQLQHTETLTLNSETIQTAVQFTLATSGAGLTISLASDFSATWGNANGLGVGTPSTGLTVYAASGGFVYETPISLVPLYSSFSTTTGTLSVYVSSNFTHSALLSMQDADTSGGPYTTISLTSASPTTITSTAASNTTITRYLGILVSTLNGPSVYNGSDNATLTYQMTVP